ncbi:hypothetical protein HYY75_05155, partial [bacterium]|nr:hypothetical protein [bacterium]
GKSTDTQDVLSALEEKGIPLALAVAETLKFKALHSETKLYLDAIEQFKNAVEKRLSTAKIVSLKKTETCTIAIPAREITIEGIRLTIPSHFIAPSGLRIIDYGPKDEAGTLLPDIWVSFASDEKIVQTQMTLDGKSVRARHAVPLQGISEKTFIYRLPLNPENVFSIGTHNVNFTLTDSGGHQASATWSFTVGIKPVSTPAIPSDGKNVGSFTIDTNLLFPQSSINGFVSVNVYETQKGERSFEYILFTGSNLQKPMLKTSSLFFLRKIITKRTSKDIFTLFPKTKLAFLGNKLTFSYDYSGDGKIVAVQWNIEDD